MDFLNLAVLDKVSSFALLVFFALAVITDKLVWHTRLKRAEARADRWEAVALDALTSAQAGVRAAEVTVDVVSAIPDPTRDRTGRT